MPKMRAALAIAVLATVSTVLAGEKPLKIFIMAGQSNMQGKARVRTIARLNMTDDSKQMYQDMKVKDGMPSAVEGVHGVYFTAGDKKFGKSRALSVRKGPLQPGFGSSMSANTTFGPEYTFGIYMQKHLNEPFLVIKCAWGGRDLVQQFRPPSGGEYEKAQCRHKLPTGYYYGEIVKHVKTVMADPGAYHPGYKQGAGCEIAGFVWFQGFNDKIQRYPKQEYGRLLACFIRDIRKDLSAPKMPFVIGVMGIGGTNERCSFRKAQSAPAALPEFKGNVVAIRTGQFWDKELVRIQKKLKEKGKSSATPEEANFLKVATSDGGYHYMGSAYIYGRIGKSFADAMFEMVKANGSGK